jgi:predicted oxidoreductase
MKTQRIGKSRLVSTRLAYGGWRLAGTWDPKQVTPERIEAGKKAVFAPYEAGYPMFDHADIYCSGEAERIFGLAMKEIRGMKHQVLIATKCGIRFRGGPNADSPQRYDFSAEHIQRSCEGSLTRLGIERIDLYQLHRPDALMDSAEVAGVFEKLKKQGKVREFGVSNFAPSQVAALQSACPMPLIVNQVEVHLGRLACLYDGTLDQCLAEKMTPLVWSPLGGGLLGTAATVPATHPRRAILLAVQEQLDKTAKAYGVSRTVIALAWLLKHPCGIIPIVGSTDPQRIRDAVKADEIDLDRENWYRLLVAARGEPLP